MVVRRGGPGTIDFYCERCDRLVERVHVNIHNALEKVTVTVLCHGATESVEIEMVDFQDWPHLASSGVIGKAFARDGLPRDLLDERSRIPMTRNEYVMTGVRSGRMTVGEFERRYSQQVPRDADTPVPNVTRDEALQQIYRFAPHSGDSDESIERFNRRLREFERRWPPDGPARARFVADRGPDSRFVPTFPGGDANPFLEYDPFEQADPRRRR